MCGQSARTDPSLGGSVQSAFVGSEVIADTYDDDDLAFQEEESASCTEDYEAQSRVIVPTTLPCSTSTLVQNKRVDLPDRPNSTVSETCLVGCGPVPGFASGDTFRALPCVGDDDNMTSLTGNSPAGQGLRCLTSPSPAPIGARKDWRVLCGTSSQVDWSVGSASTDHTSLRLR